MNGDYHEEFDRAQMKALKHKYTSKDEGVSLEEIKKLLRGYGKLAENWNTSALAKTVEEDTGSSNEQETILMERQRDWLISVKDNPIECLTDYQVATIEKVLMKNSYTSVEKLIINTIRDTYVKLKDELLDERRTEIQS